VTPQAGQHDRRDFEKEVAAVQPVIDSIVWE